MTYNWAEECEKQAVGLSFWRPVQGKHTIKIVGEPVEVMAEFPDDKDKTKLVMKTRMNIPVEIDGQHLTWGMNKAGGAKAPFGQLLVIGAGMQKQGKSLVGSTITVLVNGEGREGRTYAIQEYYDYVATKKA